MMMKNYKESVKLLYNLNLPDIPDILVIGSSESAKTSVILNLIKNINNQILTKFTYT